MPHFFASSRRDFPVEVPGFFRWSALVLSCSRIDESAL
jgi:hypothetical protein